MLLGFEFQLIWYDYDLLNLRVKAWNGAFGGVTELYTAVGALRAAAQQLQGFPTSPSDNREIRFGNSNRKGAAGGIRMQFRCVDGAGHAYVDATIDSNYLTGGTIQTVVLAVPVEAAAIDTFAQELERLERERSGTAYLRAEGTGYF
jgi:hypothetical protein